MASKTKRKVKRPPAKAASSNGAAKPAGGKPSPSEPSDPLELIEALHTGVEQACNEVLIDEQRGRIADLEVRLEYERARLDELTRPLRTMFRQLAGKLPGKPGELWHEPLRKFLSGKTKSWKAKVPAWSTLQKEGATDAELERQIDARDGPRNGRWQFDNYRWRINYLGEPTAIASGGVYRPRGSAVVVEGKPAFLAAVRQVMNVPPKKKPKQASQKPAAANGADKPAAAKPTIKPNKSRRNRKPATQAEITQAVLS